MEQLGFTDGAERAEGDPLGRDPFVQKLKPGGPSDVQTVTSGLGVLLKCAIPLQNLLIGAWVSGLC